MFFSVFPIKENIGTCHLYETTSIFYINNYRSVFTNKPNFFNLKMSIMITPPLILSNYIHI